MPHSTNDIQTWFSHVRERISLSGAPSSSAVNSSSDQLIHNISSIIRNAQYDQLLPFCQEMFHSIKKDADSGKANVKEDVCHVLPSLIYAYLSLYQYTYEDSGGDSGSGPLGGVATPVQGTSRQTKRRAQQQSAMDMLQTVLLAVYNLCAASKSTGSLIARLSLEMESVYHNPSSYASRAKATSSYAFVADQSLPGIDGAGIEHFQDSGRDVYPIYETINGDNMWIILSANLNLFNNSLHRHSPLSFTIYCQLVEFLVSLKRKSTRIPNVNENFIVELCTGLYFHLFNKGASEAKRALRAIEQRATYDSMCNVLLIINSIRNSLETNPSGSPHDGPVGLKEVASTLLDDASHPLTNATFHTSKLPDDINPEEVKIVDKKISLTNVPPVQTATLGVSPSQEVPLDAVLPSVPPFYDPTVKKVTTKERSWVYRHKNAHNGVTDKLDDQTTSTSVTADTPL